CDRGYSTDGADHVSKHKHQMRSCLQSSTVKISGAIKLPSSSMVQVAWGDGETDVYPYVWLRDHCQCPDCFHPITKSRILSLGDLQLAVSPTSIQVVEDGRRVEIGWSDGHLGTYPASWLHQCAFNTHHLNLRAETVRMKQKFWGCELSEDLPRASFPELLENDWALLSFLQQLEVMGLVLISQTPAQTKQCQLLSQRVAYCSRTQYGETFKVHNKTNPNNLAYTHFNLDLHTDQPCLSYKPGVSVFSQLQA
ncbi:gamma-butyrobetaine dioxygenase-like, partial [Cherax quadricarinatus]|uniref:gamma-butyrobetaine dioxygenase-like n=1 Tax=Cherax quadricarinatus TaxID=27406 RepID=UPI00387E354F